MEPLMIRDPDEAFVNGFLEEEDMPLGEEFQKGGKLYRYTPIMMTIYRIMARKEQTRQWVKMATEVIIPFIKECDDLHAREEEEYVELFRKYHDPGNIREKYIIKAEHLMSQLTEDDPVLAAVVHRHRKVIVSESHMAYFQDGKATIQYNDGKWKDQAEAFRLDPLLQMPKPQSPCMYKPVKRELDWIHPRREPGDNLEMKRPLYYVLRKLCKENPTEAQLFENQPVAWIETTYTEKIKEPRSLFEIDLDIRTPSWGGYGATAFLKDMRLLFSNARQFYGRDSHRARCGDKLEREMRRMMAEDLGDDGKTLDLYDEIVVQAIAANPETASYARPMETSNIASPTETATDPTSAPARTDSVADSNLSRLMGQGDSEDDEEPINAKGRRDLSRKTKATIQASVRDAGHNKVFKIRELGCSVAEHEERRLAYEADFNDNKRARSDDDTDDERLWQPRKRAKVSPNPADTTALANLESSQAEAEPAEGSVAQSAVESSSAAASSSSAQPATSSSSRSRKRDLSETDCEDVIEEIGAQAKRQKTAHATPPQQPGDLGPPSAVDLGFATKHTPIKIETLARYNAARRSWLFAYRSDQGLGVYSIKCPNKACRHAFKQNPLLDNRTRDHLQQCGHMFDDDQAMLRECAQQVVYPSDDRRFTIDWMKDVYNASIIKSSADKLRLEMENFPSII